MESFTADQLLTLAKQWRMVAQALSGYQTRHWTAFTTEQHLDINAYQNSLLSRADDLENSHVRAIIHEALPAYSAILAAATCASNTLGKSKEIIVGLNIGAMTVALAAAVARGQLKSIEVAIRELSDLREME